MTKCTKFELLTTADKILHLNDVAARALTFWQLPKDSDIKLISWSENATYRINHLAFQQPIIMRVHRTGYHSRSAILTELTWMRALQHDASLQTPQAIAGHDGEYIYAVESPALSETRYVVLFDFIAGNAPDEKHLLAPFMRLGEVTARLHQHAKTWARPDYFERLLWDYDGCLGKLKHWGDWRDAPGLNPEIINTLAECETLIKERLNRFGKSAKRFGLIHADLRLANLLEGDGQTRVIDFDDAGLGWFLYDLASALSFIETRDDIDDLIQAWLQGYKRIAPLTKSDEEEIPTFIILRRMTLLAWIGSHAETELAKSQGVNFTEGTYDLALKYLAKYRLLNCDSSGQYQ